LRASSRIDTGIGRGATKIIGRNKRWTLSSADGARRSAGQPQSDRLCGEAQRASAATGLSFPFALVAKHLLLLPIEKIT
jgi:hypothetical protein